MSKEFKIPETIAEAQKLKKELLEKINAYNEALFNDAPLPYTEFEIDEFQEQYEILSDNLALTSEEKIAKLDDSDKVINDDGTVTEKDSFFDKIKWYIYVYGIISSIFVAGAITKPLGDTIFMKFITGYFQKIYDKTENIYAMYSTDASTLIMNKFLYWFLCTLSFVALPLVLVLITLVIYLIFKKRNDTNTKVLKYLLYGQIAAAVISVGLIISIYAIKNYHAFYERFDDQYFIWAYQKYMASSSGY